MLVHGRSQKKPTVPRVKVMWSDFRAEARKIGFNKYIKEKEEVKKVFSVHSVNFDIVSFVIFSGL